MKNYYLDSPIKSENDKQINDVIPGEAILCL